MSEKKKKIPKGISVIHFDDESKNIHAEMPLDKEQAKGLSKRIYKDAMTDLSIDKNEDEPK
jgi:hypothetical protein